ncbi:MAG TPA: hypothetical protein VMW52_05220, partial [Phycisphaerae bacterium]|nr:hypothetical protein [Phycisphaerae bacterium]
MTTETEGAVRLGGFWLVPWALWHLFWLAGMSVVPAMDWPVLTWYLWLYVAFVPLEIAGVVDRRDDADKSVAKT